MKATINSAIRSFGIKTLIPMLGMLRYRCEQTIEQIIEDVECMGETTVLNTDDGPLVHCQRGSKILGVAHMDYVSVPHKWKYLKRTQQVFTPRLDDRLGVFVLLDLLPALGVDVDFLLTDSEECGCSTASSFKKPDDVDYNWMVQFDRRGDDLVMYDYEEDDTWDAAVRKGNFKVGMGTFSDISNLTGVGICAMNVGVGYHHEHSTSCYGDLYELVGNIRKFLAFFEANKSTKYTFTPKPRTYSYYRGGGYTGYGYGYSKGNARGYWQKDYGSRSYGVRAPGEKEFAGLTGPQVRAVWLKYLDDLAEAKKRFEDNWMTSECEDCGCKCFAGKYRCEPCQEAFWAHRAAEYKIRHEQKRRESEQLPAVIDTSPLGWMCVRCGMNTDRGSSYCEVCHGVALNEERKRLTAASSDLPIDCVLGSEKSIYSERNPDGSRTYHFPTGAKLTKYPADSTKLLIWQKTDSSTTGECGEPINDEPFVNDPLDAPFGVDL